MNSIYCDHCGKQSIDHTAVKEFLNPDIRTIKIKGDEDTEIHSLRVDLCEDCYKKLLEFISEGKEKIVKNFNNPIQKFL